MRPGALLAGLLLLAAPALAPAPAAGQEGAPGAWEDARARELVERAQRRRAEVHADTALRSYRAEARGYVYFYLDRTDTGERNLVKTDQLALDVMWQAPDQVKQRIVGWRDEKSLPTNIRYHLDHLTVVLENFGDEIRLGDGDEVRGVLHPAAPGARDVYQYRLVDSLTLALPGAGEPVRVYELQVRPRADDRPAFLGSVFVDRREGDIVRMDFTFTSAAYVDRYLDYINISLDNGLWMGRFWLPNEQRVEIRRRIPQLDIPAGSVIRGTMRVGAYRFNDVLPEQLFFGPAVVAVAPEEREAFPFEEALYAEVEAEGIGPAVELGEIRRMAAELVREEALDRVRAVRLLLPRASEVVRYNRAEGAVLGAGLTLSPARALEAEAYGGWAFGAEHPLAALSLRTRAGGTDVELSGYLNRPRDLGVGPAASGAVNTLSALLAGEDYADPYYADGAELRLARALAPEWSLAASARLESHRSAALEEATSPLGGGFRPVAPVDETDLAAVGRLELRRAPASGVDRWWGGALALEGWTLQPECPAGCARLDALRPLAEAEWGRRWNGRATELRLRARGGLALGDPAVQTTFLLGGRGTLPGHDFRAFAGDRFAVADLHLGADLLQPWLRGRLLLAAGASGGDDLPPLPWPAAPTGGLRAAVGAGLGLFYDILHVDLARGLGDHGRWEVIVEARRGFWDFL